MNKQKIKEYAQYLIEAIEKDERRAEDWAKWILIEFKNAPHKIHERLEKIEKQLKKLEEK